MQQSKRRIIKTRAGELGHLECHYLGKDQIVCSKRRHWRLRADWIPAYVE